MFILFVLLIAAPAIVKADITLVTHGESHYSIVIPVDAPKSIHQAAKELRRDIKLSTGAKLSIKKDTVLNKSPFISLGTTLQAKDAGLGTDLLQVEGFRILTKDSNLYIIGVDTPNGGKTPQGGVSTGTANGVYQFLEQYLGVRWLMPGELGLDVPTHNTIQLSDIDQTYAPLFTMRKLGHLWDYADQSQFKAIKRWYVHQRIGPKYGNYSTHLYYSHNWVRTLNRSANPNPLAWGSSNAKTPAVQDLYKKHPGWFAMNAAGKRRRPTSHTMKLETTNQELVKWFAQQAIRTLKARVANKLSNTFSLSPSDGRGYSQSVESKALYDPPAPGSTHPSVTPLILKWYRDVSRIVARKYPQGRLSGFIYQDYLYPPQQGDMKLPNNFTPMIAFSPSYDYGLYRKDTQKLFHYVMDAWAKIIPKDWYYYDLPNQLFRQDHIELGSYHEGNFPGGTGNVMPAAPDILNIIFPTLVKDHIKGAYIYGTPCWGSSAMTNYLLAKMMWNPNLDAYAVQKDWLDHAYGPKAGAIMLQFYTKLNGWFKDYYVQHADAGALSLAMLKNLYAPHYAEMEKLFLRAQNQSMTAKQKQRLQLIGDNLIVLQWRLRNVGYWPTEIESSLQRNTRQVIALITHPSPDFQTFPGISSSEKHGWISPQPFPWKVQWANKMSGTVGKAPPRLKDNTFVIYATQDGAVRIQTQKVVQGPYFASYEIKDASGKVIQSGIWNEERPVHFSAKAKHAYYLYIPPRKPVHYKLKVENAAVATGGVKDGVLYLTGKSAPVFVYYPATDAPVGVYESSDSVTIAKPYSGTAAFAELRGKGKYHDIEVLHSLDMGWRFHPDPDNTGKQRGVTDRDFDDNQWATLSAVDWWQRQGFADYHGPAWYRIKFNSDKLSASRMAWLYFGAVDGNAEVYLNGRKIGVHHLGQHYKGWNKPFLINVTHALRAGKNILAVKVISKNKTSASGIFKGVSLLTAVGRQY